MKKPIPTPRTDAATRHVTIQGSTLFPPHRPTYRQLAYLPVAFGERLEREIEALYDFINREMKMTADDPRIQKLKESLPE